MWQIVGEPEADATSGKISVNSPIARALTGKTEDAIVEVMAPRGVRTYRVKKVEWLDDGLRKRPRGH